jgi:hypothetical protein
VAKHEKKVSKKLCIFSGVVISGGNKMDGGKSHYDLTLTVKPEKVIACKWLI